MPDEISESVKAQIKQDIVLLYENVTKKLSELSAPCTSCGFCCHFDAAEHALYASTLEIMFVTDKYQTKPISSDAKVCPFLKNNMCSIRDRRMLGCRTYFRLHTKEEKMKAEEIYEHALSAFKQLHQKHQIPWNYQDSIVAFQDEFGIEEK